MSSRDHLSSLKRGLRALSLLNERGTLTSTDLARALGVPRTTAHRVLATLVAEGYADQNKVSHTYTLTERVCGLSAGYNREAVAAKYAQVVLNDLAKHIPWPTLFSVTVGDNIIVRASNDHLSPLAITRYATGSTTPLLHTTSGQVILAFSSDSAREEMLSVLRRSTDQRQMLAQRPFELGAIVQQIRSDGYRLIEYPYYAEGSFAVPVFVEGEIAGALVVRYIKKAIRPPELVHTILPRLLAAATTLGANIEAHRRAGLADAIVPIDPAEPHAAAS